MNKTHLDDTSEAPLSPHTLAVLKSIFDYTSKVYGPEFFNNLVRALSSTLNVRYALAAEIREKTPAQANTLALCDGGTLVDNFTYELEGTPCEKVAEKGLCIFPNDLQARFPRDEILIALQVQGYIGTPLRDHDNNVLGILALMDDKPLTDVALARSLMELFAARAAMELGRIRIEEKLLVTQAAVDHTTDSLFWVRPDGSIEYVNAQACRTLEYSREELLGMGVSDFAVDFTPNKYRELWEFLKRERHILIESRARKKSGLVYPIELNLNFSVFRNSEYVFAFTRDITERHEAERRLREERAFSDNLIQTSNVMVIGLDAEGRIQLFNPMAESITGYRKEEIEDRNWFETLVPKDRYPQVWDVFSRLQDGDMLRTFENPILTKGGEERIIAWSNNEVIKDGKIVGTVSFGLDVTDYRKADEALRQSEERHRLLVGASPNFILVIQDRRISFANPSALELLGYAAMEELVGLPATEIITPDFREQIAERMKNLEQRRHNPSLEVELLRADGSILPIEAASVPITWEGRAAGMVIGQDITERKQAEEELNCAFEEIRVLKERVEAENIMLHEELRSRHLHGDIISQSQVMKSVLLQAEKVAKTDAIVLIQGETGTGKELLARAIHNMSPRKKRPLITVNCAAMPPTLVESELFGRERGAYTGALTKQVGRFEIADHSTIFLDEIGEVPLEVQTKLLRVIQEGQFERLGSPRTISVDARVIVATYRNLEEEVKEGRFREDLYYRLNVFPLYLPPLRERTEDIPLLLWSFIKELGEKMGKKIERISKKGMEQLKSYPWPGNVRELRNVIERAMILSTGPALKIELPAAAGGAPMPALTLKDVERRHISKILEQTSWRIRGKQGAAELLGLKPSTLESRMKKLGIKRPQ